MEANVSFETSTSQSLMLLFSFLDIKSINLCKLVNKMWYEHVTKYFKHRELTLYKEIFSYGIKKTNDLSDAEINEISSLLFKSSKAAILIQNKMIQETRIGANFLPKISDYKPTSHGFCLLYAFAVFVDTPCVKRQENDVYGGTLEIALCNFSKKSTLRLLKSERESPGLILRLDKEKLKKIERYFERMRFDFERLENETPRNLRYDPRKKIWFGFWIKLALDCAKRRLGLSEKCQEVFDEIYLNAPDGLKEELVRVSRCKNAFIMSKFEAKSRELVERVETLEKKNRKSEEKISNFKEELVQLQIKLKKTINPWK